MRGCHDVRISGSQHDLNPVVSDGGELVESARIVGQRRLDLGGPVVDDDLDVTGLDSVERRCDESRINLVAVVSGHHVGVCGTKMNTGDKGALLGELEPDAVSQAPLGGFGATVGVGADIGEPRHPDSTLTMAPPPFFSSVVAKARTTLRVPK